VKRAILWCGQVEPNKRPRTFADKKPSKKEIKSVHDGPEMLWPYDDFSLQANGLELSFQAACKLGVRESEIYACVVQADLCPQGLQTEVRRATRDALERLLHDIVASGGRNDAILFIAVNHGSLQGLTTAEDVADPMRDDGDTILTPTQLDAIFHVIDGPQVLVIVTCHAGVFSSLGHENRCVVAACAAHERYLVPRCDNLCSPFLDELFGAWCGCSLDASVPGATLPLQEAFVRAKDRMSRVPGLSIPQIEGKATWPSSELERIGNWGKSTRRSD